MIGQQQALERLAMTDQLTGLYNRHYLNAVIQPVLSLAKRRSYALCLVMIDLDKFKYTNDIFGHEVGDEFLLVLPQREQRQAQQIANRICVDVSNINCSAVQCSAVEG